MAPKFVWYKTTDCEFALNRVAEEHGHGADMELPRGRSAAESLSPSFHPNWTPHWPNELQFGFE